MAAVIPVRQFPKTTSGKIQRFALARDYEEGRFADVLAELARHDAGRLVAGAAPRATSSRRCSRSARRRCPTARCRPTTTCSSSAPARSRSRRSTRRSRRRIPGYLEVTDFFEYPTVRTMAAFLAQRQAEVRRTFGEAARFAQSRVKRLVVLPLAVQPQPVGGAAADLLLQHARIALDDLRTRIAIVRRLGEQP